MPDTPHSHSQTPEHTHTFTHTLAELIQFKWRLNPLALMDVSKAAAGWLQPSSPSSSCFSSPSCCVCCQYSALFCGQSAGCGAVLTLLYNCQFFAAAAAAATDELSHSSACLSVCLCPCVPVCCCVGGLLSESGGGFVVLLRVRDSEWVCVCVCVCVSWNGLATLQYSFEGIIDIDEQCCRVVAVSACTERNVQHICSHLLQYVDWCDVFKTCRLLLIWLLFIINKVSCSGTSVRRKVIEGA